MTDRSELGAALRAWRVRLAPAAVGLPAGRGRRTPGLRREEVAALAGVSVDYLTRLEQGRATAPSDQVIEALGRALQLSRAESDHLRLVARRSAPTAGRVSRHVTPGMQRLMDRLSTTPLSVFDATWTLVTANRLWAALIGDWTERTGLERNVVWSHFAGLPTRVAHDVAQSLAFERAMVTDLRAATARYPDSPGLAVLIAALLDRSSAFAALWETHEVAAHVSARKTVLHPAVGPVTLDCDVLTVPDSDLRIVVYTAVPGSEDADKLRLLDVIGTQAVDVAPHPERLTT